MEKINVVVVLCNDTVYGVWNLPEELSTSKKNDIRHAIKEKVKSVETKDVFTVAFDTVWLAEDSSESLDGILASIENSY